MLGDNVYGDCRTDGCPELKEAYDALEAHPSYRGAKASLPMLITWDDHDYGLNDGGAANPYRDYAKELFLEFDFGELRAAALSCRVPPPGFGPEVSVASQEEVLQKMVIKKLLLQ